MKKLFKRTTAGAISLAMLASAAAALPLAASAAGSEYSGTPTWTALTGSSEMYVNYIPSTKESVNASAHKHDGGSGDRKAYTYFTDVTPGSSNKIEVEFYLNISGANQNASHFYLMSVENKGYNDPVSGHILDIEYSNYLTTVKLNETNITECFETKKEGYFATSGAKYQSTGLVKYDAILDYSTHKADVTIYGTSKTKRYTVDFMDNSCTGFKGFYSNIGRALAGCAIYDVNVSKYYNAAFDIDGTETIKAIKHGSAVAELPSTDKTGYVLKGWTVNDGTKLYTSEQIKSMTITSDTKFTAVYGEYVEGVSPIKSVVISGPESMSFGPNDSTPAENAYSLTITNEEGNAVTGTEVNDFSVSWDIEGFKTENDNEGQYCDSYGDFRTNNDSSLGTIFDLRSIPMNFYGKLTATVTYNGTIYVGEKSVAALGDTTKDSKTILPEGGYPSDFDTYPDALKNYSATQSTDSKAVDDIISGNFFAAGSDPQKGAVLTSDSTGKYFTIGKSASGKSSVFAHKLSGLSNGQYIFEQELRFNTNKAGVIFRNSYATWSADNREIAALMYDSGALKLNGKTLMNGEDDAGISTNTWYKVIVSLDTTTYNAWARVYSTSGILLGEIYGVDFTNNSVPEYYVIGYDNSAASAGLDFAGYRVYYPTAAASTYTLEASQEELSILTNDTATLEASLTTAEGYPITGNAVWTVLESDMRDKLTIVPDTNDSHKAVVSLPSGAAAGDATVQVSIGGYTKSIVISITSSTEKVKFTESKTSIAIPLDDALSTTTYKAIVVDENNDVYSNDVQYSLYDKNNKNLYTPPAGISFNEATGVLTVDKTASAAVFTVRATGKNANGEDITRRVLVNVYGLKFDFGNGLDEDVASGYASVSANTPYTAGGYGLSEGAAAVGGTDSTTDANSDYLSGALTFKADVPAGERYTVNITYKGTLVSGYVNEDLAGYTLGSHVSLSSESYTVPVPFGTIDLSVSGADPQIASVTMTKDTRNANAVPDIHHVGDSTAANNGSWAYSMNNKEITDEATGQTIATFYNNGAGGRNLCTYYTEGKLKSVLNSIEPGDIMMFGNNGTNGMGKTFEYDVNYYLNAAEAMGAYIIINSYTPHGAVGDYTSVYNSSTHTFNGYRQDQYDVIVRKIADERADGDPNYLGFVEIGKNADAAFNAYVADYAANGYASADAAAQEIISCFSDHNHYSKNALARTLMIDGYGDVKGIDTQIKEILDAAKAKAPVSDEPEKIVSTDLTGYPAEAYVTRYTQNYYDTQSVVWRITNAEEMTADYPVSNIPHNVDPGTTIECGLIITIDTNVTISDVKLVIE